MKTLDFLQESEKTEEYEDLTHDSDDFLEESEEPSFSEDEILRDLCRESLYDFVIEFWDVVVHEEPVWNWHIRAICDELQRIAQQVFDNLPLDADTTINISPGSTKTILTGVMFPAWIWTRMPHAVVISASYALEGIADDASSKSRDVILSEKYQRLFPEIKLREDTNAKANFKNTLGGVRYAFGVGGSVTGKHAHFIIVDDPLNPEQAASEAELARANRWMTRTLPSRKVNKKVCPTILIMQRLAENDPTGERIEKEKRGYRHNHWCLPAELTEDVKPQWCRDYYVDGLMDPVRCDAEVLERVEQEQDEFTLAAQYLQRPIPEGTAMFHVGKLTIEDEAPRDIVRRIRAWDKAGTELKSSAYTVGLLLGVDSTGHWWVLDVLRDRLDSWRRERLIRKTAAADTKSTMIAVEQEPGSGGKHSAQSTVAGLAGYRVVALAVGKSDGDKAARAYPVSAQVNAGNVSLLRADWNRELINEMRYFPNSRYKDQCLPAGTLVFCKKGMTPIEQVNPGDEVMTRAGWRRVLESGMTSYHARTVGIEYGFDGVLECTHSHPVLVGGQHFVDAADLREGDEITVCPLTSMWSCGTALNGEGIPTPDSRTDAVTTKDTWKVDSLPSIEPNGRRLTERYQTGMTYITRTATPLTTDCPTFSYSPSQSIEGWRESEDHTQRRRQSYTWQASAQRPLSGIEVLPAGSGTGNTRNTACGPFPTGTVFADHVVNRSGRETQGQRIAQASVINGITSEKRSYRPSAAGAPSPSRRLKEPGDSVLTPVVRLRDMRRDVPVYNLKVEGVPEFFANGVLVHNCDALALAFNVLSGKRRVLGGGSIISRERRPTSQYEKAGKR
jgi:predicted phage terminase large subunit-like protein